MLAGGAEELCPTEAMVFDALYATSLKNDAPYYNHPELGHDYSDKTYTGWSPRLSAFWKITPQTARHNVRPAP